MRVVTVVGPDPFLDLGTTKSHLRVDSNDADPLINLYIAAVCGHLDGTSGWLGRAVGNQTLEVRGDGFPTSYVQLPYPPLRSVVSVKYDDAGGVEQTLDPASYEVDEKGLFPALAQSWPTPICRRGSARIRYLAGYNYEPPGAIMAAALLMVGDLFANRETAVTSTIAASVPMSASAENLLSPYRVWTC